MKVAYFDCQFGAAGDMLLGALIDAGLNKEAWLKELEKIALPENSFEVKIRQVQRRTLAAKKVDVIIGANAPPEFSLEPKTKHSHGMQQEYAGDHEHGHGVVHGTSSAPAQQHKAALSNKNKIEHEHGHDHAHGHLHEHQHEQTHEHPHLHDHTHEQEEDHGNGHHHDGPAIAMADVQAVIRKSTVSDAAKEFALRVVSRLGSCEGPVHGFAPDAIYFHEVGAVDTIVDIIGFAVGYEMLGIQKSYVSAVPMGSGHVLTAVGYFPVPAPAVALMLAHINAPTLDYEIGFECLTPTGVAILAELCPTWGIMPKFSAVKTVGYGAGSKDSLKHPNVCRVMIGEMVNPV